MRLQQKYHPIHLLTEAAEAYRPGGYHPVHIGDRLGPNKRYVIHRKLGFGADGTVWLAHDPSNTDGKEWVAIKILKASESYPGQEPIVYSQLSKADGPANDAAPLSKPDPPMWTQFIVPLLSSFTHVGPNGNHTCLILDSMGCSVGHLLRNRPRDIPWKQESISDLVGRGLTTRPAKYILRQMLGDLVFLHSADLIHGDLHLGNALFTLQSPQANPKLKTDLFVPQDPNDDEIAQEVRRLDGKDLDEHVPRYLIAQDDSLIPYTALAGDRLKPKLIDIKGQAPITGFFNKTPTTLCSPELAFQDTASQFQDIWAFGCAIFEILTGYDLFPLYDPHHRTRETEVDDLMLRFSETLGPLPSAIETKWKRHSLYFDDQGRRNERMPVDDWESAETKNQTNFEGDMASNASSGMISIDSASLKADLEAYFAEVAPLNELSAEESTESISFLLEDVFDRFKPSDMTSEEGSCVKGLLRRIFQYEPDERPHAADLLKDSWFASFETEFLSISEPNRNSPSQQEPKGKRKRSREERGRRKKG